MSASTPCLSAHHLTLRHGGRTLIDTLSLELSRGEILGILGANGVGKSSLLTVLAGLARPVAGEVLFAGQPVLKLAPRVRARNIGFLPQADTAVFFGCVAEFVALGHYPHDTPLQNLDAHLAEWALSATATRSMATLSGGERQRARLAQLCVQNPQLYLLDEPLTHLDPAHQARLLDWARAQTQAGKTVVLTLHDPSWAASHCNRLLFLYGDGRWHSGTPMTMLSPTALEELYGPGTAALWQRWGLDE